MSFRNLKAPPRAPQTSDVARPRPLPVNGVPANLRGEPSSNVNNAHVEEVYHESHGASTATENTGAVIVPTDKVGGSTFVRTPVDGPPFMERFEVPLQAFDEEYFYPSAYFPVADICREKRNLPLFDFTSGITTRLSGSNQRGTAYMRVLDPEGDYTSGTVRFRVGTFDDPKLAQQVQRSPNAKPLVGPQHAPFGLSGYLKIDRSKFAKNTNDNGESGDVPGNGSMKIKIADDDSKQLLEMIHDAAIDNLIKSDPSLKYFKGSFQPNLHKLRQQHGGTLSLEVLTNFAKDNIAGGGSPLKCGKVRVETVDPTTGVSKFVWEPGYEYNELDFRIRTRPFVTPKGVKYDPVQIMLVRNVEHVTANDVDAMNAGTMDVPIHILETLEDPNAPLTYDIVGLVKHIEADSLSLTEVEARQYDGKSIHVVVDTEVAFYVINGNKSMGLRVNASRIWIIESLSNHRTGGTLSKRIPTLAHVAQKYRRMSTNMVVQQDHAHMANVSHDEPKMMTSDAPDPYGDDGYHDDHDVDDNHEADTTHGHVKPHASGKPSYHNVHVSTKHDVAGAQPLVSDADDTYNHGVVDDTDVLNTGVYQDDAFEQDFGHQVIAEEHVEYLPDAEYADYQTDDVDESALVAAAEAAVHERTQSTRPASTSIPRTPSTPQATIQADLVPARAMPAKREPPVAAAALQRAHPPRQNPMPSPAQPPAQVPRPMPSSAQQPAPVPRPMPAPQSTGGFQVNVNSAQAPPARSQPRPMNAIAQAQQQLRRPAAAQTSASSSSHAPYH